MNRGFYTIMAAQFFSALADNALLFAALVRLDELNAPDSYDPVLQMFFVVSYVVLAPFVGPLADAMPKGVVMFISNAIKIGGCMAMLFGLHPLYAYFIVGFGAAAYSPAKYGIITEYLPHHLLVKANGWLEGLTVAAIILGSVIGGILINPKLAPTLLPGTLLDTLLTTSQFAIAIIISFYFIAAWFNLYIPRIPLDHRMPKKNPLYILHDFWHCFKLLWRDPLGQVSLAVTTLFWGAGSTLKLIVITWAAAALQFGVEQATQLTAVVALGIAIGATIAGKVVTLEKSVKVLPAGIAMGFLVIAMIWVGDWRIALVLLFAIGALAGFFVVPLNALLQHRGHLLMGAGHSIAVQNFNENLGILVLNGLYAMMIDYHLSIYSIIGLFGMFVSTTMYLISRRYRHIAAH
ncbi:MAG: lysophospholipid transporter LplT [Pseudomonadota bacterium]